MYPSSFTTAKQISNTLLRISRRVDKTSYIEISKIFYDAIKLSALRLKEKRDIGKSKRRHCTLSKKDITNIINLLCFFHVNDRYCILKHKSELTGCYHPTFSEADAWRYFEEFIEGTTKDKNGVEILFTPEFMKSLYKDCDGNHVVESEHFVPLRAKRLPLIIDTIKNTENIFIKIDEYNNSEMMYINRYKDPFENEYYQIVIVKKYKKDKTAPYIAKTAFHVFRYNRLLTRLNKYEPIKKDLSK
jgi:hypothetical protein